MTSSIRTLARMLLRRLIVVASQVTHRASRATTVTTAYSGRVIGEEIGNYLIVAELGKGGMGVVYRAEHVKLGRAAAVKMLLPQFSSDDAIVQRFFNEARAAASIEHPGIVEIFDFGAHHDGRAYIVMPLLKGHSLAHRLQQGSLPADRAATIAAQIAGALVAAHARGIVHRDLKPDNIFLVPNELLPGGIQVKLLDFGIAKLVDDRAADGDIRTQTGSVLGTPAYMSPEQCMGKTDLDHRTDLYAVGCILFHMLCGRAPFTTSHGVGMLIASHLRDPAPDPRSLDPTIPADLAAITLRLLEKDPAVRVQTAVELYGALVAAGADVPAAAVMRPVEASAPTVASGRYTGPEAYLPTTGGDSSAEVISPAAPPRTRVWLVAGVATTIAAAVVIVMLPRSGEPPAIALVSGSDVPAPPVIPDAPTPPITPQDAPRPVTALPDATSVTAPEDASTAAIDVVVIGERPRPTVIAEQVRTLPVAEIPQLTLDREVYPPDGAIAVRFAAPVPSTKRNRAWITITLATAADNAYQYEATMYLPDRVTRVTLTAPGKEGLYEVRVHDNYPTEAYRLRRRSKFTVSAAAPRDAEPATPLSQQRFTVRTPRVSIDTAVAVEFPVPLRPEGKERFWITIVKSDAPDNAHAGHPGGHVWIPPAASQAVINTPMTPGTYEIRLHARYPTHQANVVHRARLEVTP